MRIVIDFQACQNGSKNRGIGRYALEMTKALLALETSHEFIIALSDRFPGTSAHIRKELSGLIPPENIVMFSLLERSSSADPLNYWRTRASELLRHDFLNSLRPDIVFVPSLFEGFWDASVVSVEHATYLTAVTVYDFIPFTDPARYLPASQDQQAYARKLHDLRKADILLPISEFVAQETLNILAVDPSRITPTPLGVDAKFKNLELNQDEKTLVKQKYGITSDFLLNTSPLEHRKNIEGLVAAYARLNESQRASTHLVIVGKMNEPARRILNKLARAEAIDPERIILTGYVSDEELVKLYNSAKLFVFPSFSEGFGLPILEAMACGTPVVGSNTTSLPEVLGREDIQFDPVDPSSIARAMERVLSDPELADELRAYGKERAARFTWKHAALRALEAFERHLNQRRTQLQAPLEISSESLPKTGQSKRLAIVVDTIDPANRLVGLHESLCESLAEHFEITIISANLPKESPWGRQDHSVQSFEWFRVNAPTFDKILYSSHRVTSSQFSEIAKLFPGAVLFHENSSADLSREAQIRQRVAALRGLFHVDGYYGLRNFVENKCDYGSIITFCGREVLNNQRQILLRNTKRELSEDLLGSDVDLTSSFSTAPSSDAGRLFRQNLGIKPETLLVVAIFSDEQRASQAIREFKPDSSDQRMHLLVHVTHSTSTETDEKEDILQAAAGVSRIFSVSDANYRSLTSGADAFVLDSSVRSNLSHYLQKDAIALRRPLLLSDNEGTGAQFAQFLGTLHAEEKRQSVIPRTATSIATPISFSAGAKHASAALKLRDELLLAEPAQNVVRMLQFGGLLPAKVNDVSPLPEDLAALSIAFDRNMTPISRPRIFLDISSVAASSSRNRLDPIAKRWLLDLLSDKKLPVEPVYISGSQFVSANNFVHNLLGLQRFEVNDELIQPTSFDVFLGLDVLGSFDAAARTALANADDRGASIQYVMLGNLSLERESIRMELVKLISAWSSFSNSSRLNVITDLSVDRSIGSISIDPDIELEEPYEHIFKHGIKLSACLLFGKNDISHLAERYQDLQILEAPLELLTVRTDIEKKRRDKSLISRESPRHDAGRHYVVMGHLLGTYSLAIINRNIARALEAAYPGDVRYAPIETIPIENTEGVPESEKELMTELVKRKQEHESEEIVICHHYPVITPTGNYRLKASLFYWEETCVPSSTVVTLEDGFDYVISPSSSVTRALINSGFKKPIATIGQPVDIVAFQQAALQRNRSAGATRFLHVSSCFKRKGVDVLLSAWAAAFTSADDVLLTIKTFPNPHNNVEDQLAALKREHKSLAPIEIINSDMNQADLVSLYSNADVMVLPTRGEGYNLPALEAIAAGLPLIVTGFGGHMDFCSSQSARLLKFRLAYSESHVRDGFSLWAEPDQEDLVAALREMVSTDHRASIKARTQRALITASREGDTGSWLRRNEAAVDVLLSPTDATAPRIGWVSTWLVQCGIAEYSNYLLRSMSRGFKDNLIILSDDRTLSSTPSQIQFEPAWSLGSTPKLDALAQAITRNELEALVIQHQDGLISWEQIGLIGSDSRFKDIVTVAVLHNARNLRRVGGDELATALNGLSSFSRVVVHNLDDVNYLCSHGLFENVTLLPHGAAPSGTAPWPRKLGSADAPVIGCHGFFFRHKGIDKLIRAAALLREEWPNLRLKLVNARFPGGQHDAVIDDCRSLAADLGMSGSIDWIQDFLPADEIQAHLASCDLIVLPYDESDDSASGAVRVALSSMVPLVATRVQIFAELNDAAAWAASNDPGELARTIAPLLRSPMKRREVQAAMHEWLSAHDWGRVGPLLEGVIQSLINQKRVGFK